MVLWVRFFFLALSLFSFSACERLPLPQELSKEVHKNQTLLDLLQQKPGSCDLFSLDTNKAELIYFTSMIKLQNDRIKGDEEILFVGDSLMWLCLECSSGREGNGVFVLDSPRTGTFTKALNIGIPQATTEVTLLQLQAVFNKVRPKTMVISTTGNDILNGCSPTQIAKNRESIVRLAQLNGVTKLVWMNLIPYQLEANASQSKKEALKQANSDLEKQMAGLGILVANAYQYLTNPLNDLLIPAYIGDGYVHINQAGYDAAWMPTIKSCLSDTPTYPLCVGPGTR